MSTLTKQERDGLEDIFLSIQTNGSKFAKLRDISIFSISKNLSLSTVKFLKVANVGLKEYKISQFIAIFSKKKKFLSK